MIYNSEIPKPLPFEDLILYKCIMYFNMEGSSNTLRDYGAYRYTGVTNNGVTTVNEKIGVSRRFDGVDDYISLPYSPWHTPPEITALAWVKSFTVTEMRIFSNRASDAAMGGWELYIANNNIGVRFGDNHFGTYETHYVGITTTVLNDGKWHQIGFSYQAPKIVFWIDGVSVSEQDLTNQSMGALPMAWPVTGPNFSIGSRGMGYLLDGQLGVCCVYSRKLSNEEVKLLYDHDSQRYDLNSVYKHTTLPTFSISSPTPVTYENGTIPVYQSLTSLQWPLGYFGATCYDSAGVKSLTYRLNGGVETPLVLQGSGYNKSCGVLSTTIFNLSEGPNTIVFTVTDSANVSNTYTIKIQAVVT